MINNYLCANKHHFSAAAPRCPRPGCTAEVRKTAVNPLHGKAPSFENLPRIPGYEPPAPAAAGLETTPEGAVKHSIRWWAYVDGVRTRRSSSMRDNDYAWDATCSCGWDSATDGRPMADVDKMAIAHKAGVL